MLWNWVGTLGKRGMTIALRFDLGGVLEEGGGGLASYEEVEVDQIYTL